MNKKIFEEYFGLLKENRHFLLFYIVIVLILFWGMLSSNNVAHPRMEILSLVFIILMGSFLILYGVKNKNSLHRVAFVFLICFGLLITFLAPPFSIPDEASHLTRVANILMGYMVPVGTPVGYLRFFNPLLEHMLNLYNSGSLGISNLLLNNTVAFSPIPKVTTARDFHITNTPFFSYVFSVAGVFLAKSLNLSLIWVIWLSRLPNLIFYALIVAYAIKKAPAYKMALLLVSCTPLIVTVMPSANYDSFIYAILVLAIAYFIYMYKNKVRIKDLLIFFICCLMIGLIKPPYISFVLLAFFIPKENFSFSHSKLRLLISMGIVCVAAVLILKGLSSLSVGTSVAIDTTNGSLGEKVGYLLTHPNRIYGILNEAVNFIPYEMVLNTYYYHEFWVGDFKGKQLFNVFYFIFFMAFSILYPLKIKLSRNKRIGLAIFAALFYFGMFFALYFAWYGVGSDAYIKAQARYFVPLFFLMPLVFNYPDVEIKKIDNWIIMGIIIFLTGIFLLTIVHFY